MERDQKKVPQQPNKHISIAYLLSGNAEEWENKSYQSNSFKVLQF